MASKLEGNRMMGVDTIDRRVAELLNDPLTRQVIQADGVDRAWLAAQLRRVAERLRRETPARRDRENPWGSFVNLPSRLSGVYAP